MIQNRQIVAIAKENRIVGWLCCAMLAVGSVACAEAVALPVDSVGGRLHTLDGVKVIASSSAQKDAGSLVPVQLLNASDLRKRGAVDIDDALSHFSGVNIRDYGGAGGMKTVSVRGLGAQHTAVALDGAILSDAQTGQIDLGRFSLASVSELGLTIGDDFSLLQPARSAAAAATVQISTFSPFLADRSGKSRKRTLHLEQGSFDRYGINARWAERTSRKFAFSAIGNYLFAGNDYPYTLKNGSVKTKEHRMNSRMNSFGGELNTYWDAGERSLVDGKLYYYDNNHHLPGIVVFYNPYNNEKQHERNAFGQMRWLKSWNEKWTTQLIGKYNWQESRYADISNIYPDGAWRQNYWQREAYASALVSYTPMKDLGFSYCADYVFNNLNSNQSVNHDTERHSLLQSLTASYRVGRLRLSGRLLGSLYFNNADGTESARNVQRLSPSVAASFRILPREQLYVRIFYKDIFRVPTFTESYYYHLGNPDLSPERTHQLGVGLTMQKRISHAWPSLRVTADAYYNRIKDKITAVPYNLYIWRTLNLAKVEAKGLDLTLENSIRPAERHLLTVTANWSWQHSVNKSPESGNAYNKQLAYMPRYSGCASLAYENPWLNISVTGTGASKRFATHEHSPGTRLKGYFDFSTSVWRTFRMRSIQLEARADIQNLGNTQYELITGYPMPGRSYRLSLNINF